MAELPDADMAELPDIDVMRAGFTTNANALNTAAHQLRLAAIANTDIALQVGRLPQAPILQGQAIMALIQQMRDEIRGMREEFRARDHNMQARHFNGRIALPQSPLRVLLDVRTAQPIPNFPLHPAAIQAENHRNIFRELLEALGITSPPNAHWSIENARQDFRVAIGCSPL